MIHFRYYTYNIEANICIAITDTNNIRHINVLYTQLTTWVPSLYLWHVQ